MRDLCAGLLGILLLSGCSSTTEGRADAPLAAPADAAIDQTAILSSDGGTEGRDDVSVPSVDASDAADGDAPDAHETGGEDADVDGGLCPIATGAIGNDCGYANQTTIDCSSACGGRATAYRCSADGGVPHAGDCVAAGDDAGSGMADYCCASTACVRQTSIDSACGKAHDPAVAYWCPGTGAPAPAGRPCTLFAAQPTASFYCCTF